MNENFENIADRIRSNFADSTRAAQLRAEKCIAKLWELRQAHQCLLLLPKSEVVELQYKALFADYADGQRRLHKARTSRDEFVFLKHI